MHYFQEHCSVLFELLHLYKIKRIKIFCVNTTRFIFLIEFNYNCDIYLGSYESLGELHVQDHSLEQNR